MVEEFSRKYVATGKSREDLSSLSRNRFASLRVEVTEPDTAILLLKCKEKPILLSAAAALSKFGEKSSKHLETLFDLEIVGSIVPLIKHDDIFTRRFAMKLLCQMATISNVKDYVLKSDLYVSKFVDLLMEDSDIFIQEFSLWMIAELSKDLYGIEKLLQEIDFNFLFGLMKSSDPDVKKNTIEIVFNFTQDPFAMNRVTGCKDFSFSIIYELFNEPYRIIQQLALSVVKNLIENIADERIQETFRKSDGIDRLFNLLDVYEWMDLHFQVLSIIALSSENKRTADLIIFSGGIEKLLKYIEDIDDFKCCTEVLAILISLAKLQNGRKLLHACEFVDNLFQKLQDDQQRNNYKLICIGVARMSLYPEAAKYFIENDVTKRLIDIVKNDNLDWSHREAALFAIKQLINYDIKNVENLSKLKIAIKQLINESPLQVQVICMQILENLLQYSQYQDLSMKDYLNILCSPFDLKDQSVDELQIICCDIVSNLCLTYLHNEDNNNEIFNAIKTQEERICNLIKDSHSLPVKNAAVKLLMQLCENTTIADGFVKNGCLIYMIKNRSPGTIIPTWDSCIEMLLNAHLPSKFAYSGRLSFHDVTKNGFYAMRRVTCPFPDLEEFFNMKMCPIEAIYVVNLSCSSGFETPDEIDEDRKALRKESLTKGLSLSADELESLLNIRYGRLEVDPDLCEYLNAIKCLITSFESDMSNSNSIQM